MIEEKRGSRTLQTTVAVTGVIILSKLVGLAREIVTAGYFGTSLESDAYNIAYQVFTIMTTIFTVGLSSAFIPIYTKLRLNKGERSANAYANSIMCLFIVASLIGSVLGYFLSPQLCSLMYGMNKNPMDGLPLAVSMSQILYPALVFSAISGVLTNILNAREKFIPEQLMGFALSFCIIFSTVWTKNIEMMTYATAASYVVQVIILLPFTRGVFKFRPTIKLFNRDVLRTFVITGPALVTMAFDQINQLIGRMIGNGFDVGTVTALTKSYSIVMMVIGVLTVPVTTIMFPKLSQYVVRGQTKRLIKSIKQCTEVLLIITLPIIVIGIIMNVDIIAAMYQRGDKFTAASTAMTAPIFATYIAGVFAFGLRSFQTRVFFSLSDTRTPMFIGIVAVVCDIGFTILLSGMIGPMGITLSSSIVMTITSFVMLLALRRKLGRMDLKRMFAQLFRILLAGLFCGVVTWAVKTFLPIAGEGTIPSILRILSAGLAGLFAYLIMLIVFRVREIGSLLQMIYRRGR